MLVGRYALSFALAAHLSASDISVDHWTVIGSVGQWTYKEDGKEYKQLIGKELHPNKGWLERDGSERQKKTGSVTLMSPKSGHYTIACDDPDTLKESELSFCSGPIKLPLKEPGDGEINQPLQSLLATVMSLFRKEPTSYYQAVSRDYGGVDDVVIRCDGSAIDLLPVVSGLSKGEYQVQFAAIRDGQTSSTASGTTRVSWNPENKTKLTGPNVIPGLYSVKVTTASGDPVGEAWALVAAPGQFPEKSAQFQKVKAVTDGWKNDSPAASAQAINRAALDQLSR